MRNNKKIAVAMSGGVDSTFAAIYLKEQGYDVFGITAQLFDLENMKTNRKSCCSTDSLNDARRICKELGIEHFTIDLVDVFKKEIIDYFVETYLNGETPNPCVKCNKVIKWGALFEAARNLGADMIATGHYVKLMKEDEFAHKIFHIGKDVKKDQSYMLWMLTDEMRDKSIFPVGDFLKDEIREYVQKWHVKISKKKDSQEVCFIEDDNYKRFIKDYTQKVFPPGLIKTLDGKVVGTHKGYPFYTIGQRRGLGISMGKPYYVVKIDKDTNTVFVAPRDGLDKKEVVANNINFHYIPNELQEKGYIDVKCKVRYNHNPVNGVLYWEKDDKIKVIFDTPESAITPGQSLVCYRNTSLMVGGIIVG